MSDTGLLPGTALPPAKVAPGRVLGRIAMIQSRVPLLQVVVAAAVFAWGAIGVAGFASGAAIRANLVIASLLALASLGQTLVVLIGGLDLAVPGYITIGAVAAVELSGTHHWPLPVAALCTAMACATAGALCGFICHRFGAQSLVVTLGMYSILVSGALVVTGSSIGGTPPAQLVQWTAVLGRTFGLPVPPVVVLCVFVAVVVSVVLARTPAGRKLYATGANERAARGLLIRTGWIWAGTFAVSAAISGLVGLLIAGFSDGATASTGDPYLYSGLAAVLVGGTALGSARGDFVRTVIGAFILTELTTILSGMGFGQGDTYILLGVAIVVVVMAYGRQRRLNDRV
jgi:ribose transport system permease protein